MRSYTLLTLSSLFLSVYAQDRSSEQAEAKITDPDQECKPYSYPDVANNLSKFPTVWQTAHILENDQDAQNKWNEIKGSVPNISPKGNAEGDISQFMPTYPTNDPDCWWTYKQCIGEGDVAKVPEPMTIGFGFDDGPNCSHNAFYDFLQSQNQKATLFYIGSNVMNWPLEAQRGAADGHEICAHTWSHPHMTGLSSEDAFAELWYSAQAIKLITGVTPNCWRPPTGDIDNRIRAIAKGLGLTTMLWGYDSADWRVAAGQVTPADVDNNYQHLIDDAKSGKFNDAGAIILQHELNNFTMSEALKWYPTFKETFKSIVPVGVALSNNGQTLGSFNTGGVNATSTNSSSQSASNSSSTSSNKPTTTTGGNTSAGKTSGNGASTAAPRAIWGLAALAMGVLAL